MSTRSVEWVAVASPPPAPVEPAFPEPSGLRSTRLDRARLPRPSTRRRLLVAPCGPEFRRVRPMHLAVAVAVTLAVVAGLGLLDRGESGKVPAGTAIVRVGAGETIWDVAQRVAPGSDPRAVVVRIRQLNRIEGSALQPGQQLRVPDGR